MELKEEQHGVREAVGIFHKVDDLQAAIDELLSSGFDRAELSLLASEGTVEAKLGSASFRRIDLEDNPSTPRGGYVSPAAMGAAEGGLVGGLAYVGAVAAAGFIAVAGGGLVRLKLPNRCQGARLAE